MSSMIRLRVLMILYDIHIMDLSYPFVHVDVVILLLTLFQTNILFFLINYWYTYFSVMITCWGFTYIVNEVM